MRKLDIPVICILIMQGYTHHRVIRVNSASDHQATARCFFSGRKDMFRHYITKYVENRKRYAEAWFQINIFGQCLCMFRKRIEI